MFCRTPKLWPSFGFPEKFWNYALRSFHRGDKTLFGRFDLAVTSGGIKCFGYNADAGASTTIRDRETHGTHADELKLGYYDVGTMSNDKLTSVFEDMKLTSKTTLHVLYDTDQAETSYGRCLAKYVMGCAQRAGVRCKEVKGLGNLKIDQETVYAGFS
jgi:glutathionylspermidine synthase